MLIPPAIPCACIWPCTSTFASFCSADRCVNPRPLDLTINAILESAVILLAVALSGVPPELIILETILAASLASCSIFNSFPLLPDSIPDKSAMLADNSSNEAFKVSCDTIKSRLVLIAFSCISNSFLTNSFSAEALLSPVSPNKVALPIAIAAFSRD